MEPVGQTGEAIIVGSKWWVKNGGRMLLCRVDRIRAGKNGPLVFITNMKSSRQNVFNPSQFVEEVRP